MTDAKRQREVLRSAPRLDRRGILVAIEGLDGSGKTTVAERVRDILQTRNLGSATSGWNEAVELYNLMMRLNAAGDLTPEMRAMFGAADLAVRLQYVVEPALRAGEVVLAVKYLLPRLAHAQIRGLDAGFLTRLYSFVPAPALTVWLDVPPEVTLQRKQRGGRIGFWESGLDLALRVPLPDALRKYERGEISDRAIEREFLDFQRRLYYSYASVLSETHPVFRIDGTLPPEVIAKETADRIEQLVPAPHSS